MKTWAMWLMCLAVAMFVAPAVAADGVSVGAPAPDFELQASDGKTYKLSDFRGKQAVVVAWFPRAFTGGCTRECKSMKEDGAELRKYNVAYFTASTDPVQKNKEFAESLELDYPILSDPTGATSKAYGIYNAERNAAARVTFYIDIDGKIAHIDRQVKTDSHGKDIAVKLGELGVTAK